MVIVFNKRTKKFLAKFQVIAIAERYVMELNQVGIETEVKYA